MRGSLNAQVERQALDSNVVLISQQTSKSSAMRPNAWADYSANAMAIVANMMQADKRVSLKSLPGPCNLQRTLKS